MAMSFRLNTEIYVFDELRKKETVASDSRCVMHADVRMCDERRVR